MRVLACLIAGALLSGCVTPAVQVAWKYNGVRGTEVPISTPRLERVIVRVQPDLSRAMVAPGLGHSLGSGLSGADWAARIDEYRPAYAAALMGELAKQGQCTIDRGTPYADTFMIEFTIHCDQASSKSTAALENTPGSLPHSGTSPE